MLLSIYLACGVGAIAARATNPKVKKEDQKVRTKLVRRLKELDFDDKEASFLVDSVCITSYLASIPLWPLAVIATWTE